MGGKLSAQLVIIHTIIEILDVQVHTLVLGNLLLACLIKSVATNSFQCLLSDCVCGGCC